MRVSKIVLSSSAVLACMSLVPADLVAQTYVASWYKGTNGGFSPTPDGTVSSSVTSSVGGAHSEPWNGAHRTGGARSNQAELFTYGSGVNGDANSYWGRGWAEWVFDDVVFSDGGTTQQVVSIQARLDIEGAISSQGPFSSGGYSLEVYAQPMNGGSPSSASINLSALPATPTTHVTSSISVYTNVAHLLRVRVLTDGFGSRGELGSIEATTRWAAQPFVLPGGVTADSAQARIVANVSTAVPPAITPFLQATSPTLAGGSTTLSFTGGDPMSPGAYLFGAPPDGTSIPVASWFVLHLNPAVLISVPFTADANGDHSLTLPVDASLIGGSLGVQAAQAFLGTPAGLYGTNPWRIDIQ